MLTTRHRFVTVPTAIPYGDNENDDSADDEAEKSKGFSHPNDMDVDDDALLSDVVSPYEVDDDGEINPAAFG